MLVNRMEDRQSAVAFCESRYTSYYLRLQTMIKPTPLSLDALLRILRRGALVRP